MQIIFIILSLIGFTLTFFGVKWTYRSFKAKEIVGFPLIMKEQEFEISKPGLFALCIIGGGHVKNSGNFRVLIINTIDQKVIDLKENFMKPRFRKNWKIGVEILNFKVSNSGHFKVQIENAEDLIVKKSMLITERFFQSSLSIRNIEVMIKETIPVSKRLFGIIFLVVGVNMSAWGVMLGFNPELFG